MSETNTPAADAPAPGPIAAPAPTPAATPEQTPAPVAAPTEPVPAASGIGVGAGDGASAEAAGTAPTEPAAPEAPTYTDFTFPEGVTATPEMLGKAKEVFGKLGLPQEKAQELIDLHTEAMRQGVQGAFTQASDFWNARSQEWVAETRKTFGNQFNTAIERARGVWTEVLPEKGERDRLFADLSDTKMGDHPVLAKAMAEAGRRFQQVLEATGTKTWADAMKRLREPAPPAPGQPARAPASTGRPADRRYSGAPANR